MANLTGLETLLLSTDSEIHLHRDGIVRQSKLTKSEERWVGYSRDSVVPQPVHRRANYVRQ
jgi:hypothetical protein